jgi:hypothetical protein
MRFVFVAALVLIVMGCAVFAHAAPLSQAADPSARASDERMISVLNPTGFPPPIARRPMAARPDNLEGKTIYLVDLTFDNGDVLLQQMQNWFAQHMPGVKTIFRAKKGAYSADDPALWKEIQEVKGLMIMAIGH